MDHRSRSRIPHAGIAHLHPRQQGRTTELKACYPLPCLRIIPSFMIHQETAVGDPELAFRPDGESCRTLFLQMGLAQIQFWIYTLIVGLQDSDCLEI